VVEGKRVVFGPIINFHSGCDPRVQYCYFAFRALPFFRGGRPPAFVLKTGHWRFNDPFDRQLEFHSCPDRNISSDSTRISALADDFNHALDD